MTSIPRTQTQAIEANETDTRGSLEAAQRAFTDKVVSDSGSYFAVVLSALGDRLGLFKDLVARGPATSEALATRTGFQERYVREWLVGMRAAGYLSYDQETERFALPAAHVPTLATEQGPAFFGSIHQLILGYTRAFDGVVAAFRRGGGVPQDAYDDEMYENMFRFTGGWFENLLLPEWIPALPHVQERLEAGIRVADVGCGRGLALIRLAEAFPKSTFVGYDLFEPNVRAARQKAADAGVDDRVTFVQADVAKGLPETYDLITTFDVVHDAADPAGLLRTIRGALRPDGVYLNLDINCADDPSENVGSLSTLMYGCSMFYCMTTSLAQHGAALGTMGLTPATLADLGTAAGFRSVREVAIDNPFNNLYELRA